MPKLTDAQKADRALQRKEAAQLAWEISSLSGFESRGQPHFTDGFRLAWFDFDSRHVARLTVTVAVTFTSGNPSDLCRVFVTYNPPEAPAGYSWHIGETPVPLKSLVGWMVDLVETAAAWQPLLATPPRYIPVGQCHHSYPRLRPVPETRYAGSYEWHSEAAGIEDNADWQPQGELKQTFQRVNKADALRRIRSAAGMPNPAEACRVIIGIVNETLGDAPPATRSPE